jgi:hypothetical protein
LIASRFPFPHRGPDLADSDVLRAYRTGDAPSLPDSDKRYLADELKRVSEAIGLLVQVMKKLDARMIAHGF